MKVTQVYSLLNTVAHEILGDSAVVNEDLSNVVDIGTAIENADPHFDNYVRSMVDHVGRMVFVDRVYQGSAPSVLHDSWEYGSILEKVRITMPEVAENEDWQLTDGTSYDPFVFNSPEVKVKFFNSRVTFEVDMSITRVQVKSAFSNAVQLNAFISAIYTAIENKLTMSFDALIMRTINAGIGEVVNNNNGATYVKLLTNYNVDRGTQLTTEQALRSQDFMLYACEVMSNYTSYLQKMSTRFNIGGTEKFTPKDKLHVVLLDAFKTKAETYMRSEIFHNDLVKLPESESVAYWQGSGTAYDWESISSINVKTPSGNNVNTSNIIGVMFDNDALGVSNLDRRTDSIYNPKAEFTNMFYKAFAGYFLDLDENLVVFAVE